MSQAGQITPAINKARAQIDKVFIEEVGPFGEVLAEDCFKDWLQRGKTQKQTLKHYVILLAQNIHTLDGKKDFVRATIQYINSV